jgi:hypothetical protein
MLPITWLLLPYHHHRYQPLYTELYYSPDGYLARKRCTQRSQQTLGLGFAELGLDASG